MGYMGSDSTCAASMTPRSPFPQRLVLQVLERVWANGDIYKADYEGWYCVGCEEYKDEGDMDAQHNCPTHRTPCINRKEENYFFRLSKYQTQLEVGGW